MSASAQIAEPRLGNGRLSLALPSMADIPALITFHERNRQHLKPWLPKSAGNLADPVFWANWVQLSRTLFQHRRAVHLVMRGRGEDAALVLGQVDYSLILPAPLDSAMLGFQIDSAFQGKGFMREAVALSAEYMFNTFGIHRIVAAYVVGNDRSARLLKHLGFIEEGLSRDFLEIDGTKRDHVVTAKLASDSKASPT